jgi:hypothetical protein
MCRNRRRLFINAAPDVVVEGWRGSEIPWCLHRLEWHMGTTPNKAPNPAGYPASVAIVFPAVG